MPPRQRVATVLRRVGLFRPQAILERSFAVVGVNFTLRQPERKAVGSSAARFGLLFSITGIQVVDQSEEQAPDVLKRGAAAEAFLATNYESSGWF